MAKKENLTEKFKEGVSVEKIEIFARKYTNEVFLILSLILATISSIFGFFSGPSWSVFFAGLAAIVGIAFPDQTGPFIKKMIKWVSKSEKTTIIIIGIVRLIFSIFIPFVIFAELGLIAGYAFHTLSKDLVGEAKTTEPEKSKEEEHI